MLQKDKQKKKKQTNMFLELSDHFPSVSEKSKINRNNSLPKTNTNSVTSILK